MISVFEVVVDPDMTAPEPFTILRSTGQFVLGGFASVTKAIPLTGPVQQASDKEIAMLPESDRVGEIRSFWSTQPVYTTRGYAPVPGVHGEHPIGAGTTYTISELPPDGIVVVYANGLMLQPNVAYTLTGTTLTFVSAPTLPLYITWIVTVDAATNASDVIQYETEQYRILRVYRDPGSGYWKAFGTKMAAA